ncbi:Amino acid transporter [Actinopolymorpha cephalotaxi]|uniref:Amino acid transporter n=1 Tax=Actinopolymorpha cephalotaxi TaxID=504797 RepID=A0A1I2TH40_9ACTN|nr:APC family permease [Actinopolymorpha cephalotaxi]NYH83087.1 amino acid transporter [Actinopolymorpha cephalotaxi]SFG64232.1 Amino acid transporter [Actinopolymorpha cephalotaxi]
MPDSASSASVTSDTDAEPELRRAIGPKLLLFFVVGDILGTGIYALTGKVAGEVGGAAWMSFGLSFVVAMFTATSYVELVGKYPRAAGAALYAQRAFGIHFLTFMVAFAVMCSGLTSAGAAARTFGGDYLTEFVDVPTLLVVVAFLVVLALINFRGVSESVRLNVVLTCVEVSGLLFIIVIGAIAILRGVGEPGRSFEFNSDGNPFGLVVSGAALAFFALVGFEDSVNMAEETHNPQRVFPRALFIGISITGVIYMLVAFIATSLVPLDTLSGSDGPLLEVVRVGADWLPLAVFSLIALFAVTNSALINMLMASRLVYGMSRERIVPRALGVVHRTRRTPWAAIVFTSVLAIGLATWGGVSQLGGTTALLLLCVFTLVNAAVLVLRRDQVEHRHYRAPTVFPVLGIVCCAYLATPWSGRDPQEYAIAGVLLAIGLVLWLATWVGRRWSGATARS